MDAVGSWLAFRGRWQKISRRAKRRLHIKEVRGNRHLTPPRFLQKTIWIFWAQGVEHAPPMVQACVASWRERNPGWTVRVLSMGDLSELIEIADVRSTMVMAHQADVFRVRLLAEYGGVWVDATCYCMKPLEEWLPPLMQSGFFAFHRPAPDRQIDNWFLASEKNGLIIRQWSDRLTLYVQRRKQVGHYFWPLFLFAWEVRSSRKFRQLWAATPKVSADGPLLLQRFFQRGLGPQDLDPAFDPTAIPLHKLSWKAGKIESLAAMREWGLLPADAAAEKKSEAGSGAPG